MALVPALNINSASIKQLSQLPRVGKVSAQLIEKRRVELGVLWFEDFADQPALQTAFNTLIQEGRITFDAPAMEGGEKGKDRSIDAQEQPMSQAAVESLLSASMRSMFAKFQEEMQNQSSMFKKSLDLLDNKIERIASGVSVADSLETHGAVGGKVTTTTGKETGVPFIDETLKAIKEHAPQQPVPKSKNIEAMQERKPLVLSGGPAVNGSVSVPGVKRRCDGRGVPEPPMPCPSIPSGDWGAMKPAFPKLPQYDGTEDFYAFAIKFELIANSYGWSNEIRLLKLVEALTGNALRTFSWQRAEVRNNYHLLIKQLKKTYGKVEDPVLQRLELTNILQWADELVEDYGLRVCELATRAFSDVQSDIFEMLAREAFFKGCFNPEAARMAMMKEPETLTDAIQFTRKAAYNEQLVGHQKARVRKVTIQTDQDKVSAVPPSELTSLSRSIERMNGNIEKLCSKFGVAQEGRTAETSVRDSSPSDSPGRFSRSPSRERSGRNTDNRCFNCGEEGHFSRDCTKERRPRSPSPSARTPTTPLNK